MIRINPNYFSRERVTLAYYSWFIVKILFPDKLISMMKKLIGNIKHVSDFELSISHGCGMLSMFISRNQKSSMREALFF